MKVRELQELLSKLDPELTVVGYSEDERLQVEGRGFVLFDVVDVRTAEGQWLRLDDGTPYLKFARGSASVPMAILDVTSDF
ncbi:MAG: hypothetical protein ROW52_11845 [Anaerolineaceae bacterium]|jgi:hypothetical protein